MHEQDVRRALGRPGGLDSPAAAHTAAYLVESMGYVLAKRVGAAPGTTLVVDVAGQPVSAFAVGEDGRGAPLPAPAGGSHGVAGDGPRDLRPPRRWAPGAGRRCGDA